MVNKFKLNDVERKKKLSLKLIFSEFFLPFFIDFFPSVSANQMLKVSVC